MDHRLTPPSTTPVRGGRRLLALLAAVLLLATALTSNLPSAPAAPTPPLRYAQWEELSGTSRDYTTVMRQRPTGFPAAEVQTNSVGGSGVGVQSGGSAFLAAQTPPGARYGLSREQPYLNLRPNGLLAAPPSVTTYTFARPTPASGWTFVLGDIDADEVTIAATDDRDQPVSADDLGFRSVFNYCAAGVSPKPSCAPPNNDGTDLPTWLPGSSTLRGNAGKLDTAGASAWFEPTVAIKTLTFTYAQRSGSPVYQTWFAALSHELSGTIARPGDFDDTVTVELYDPEGNKVATTHTQADGRYTFPRLASYDGYRVQVVRPSGLTSDDPLDAVVDLSDGNATADFTLRRIVPVPVSGIVTDTETNLPLAGVTLRLTGPDNLDTTVVTGPNGRYLFDDVPAGDGYVVQVDQSPSGYGDSAPPRYTFDIGTDSVTPITDRDFALTPAATGTISGAVTARGSLAPVGQVEITITGGGSTYVVRTDDNGNYTSPDLPPGSYEIAITAPEDSTVVGPTSRTVTIPGTGGTFTHRDFQVQLPEPAPTYDLSGRVTDTSGDPVPDAVVSVLPPGGGSALTAEVEEDGRWSVPDLPAGAGYVVSVDPPDGYQSPADRSVTITDDDVDGIAFVLTPSEQPSSPPPSSSSPSATTSASATQSSQPSPSQTSTGPGGQASSSPGAVAGQGLANTGGPSAALLVAGIGALVLGGLCVSVARLRSSRRLR